MPFGRIYAAGDRAEELAAQVRAYEDFKAGTEQTVQRYEATGYGQRTAGKDAVVARLVRGHGTSMPSC